MCIITPVASGEKGVTNRFLLSISYAIALFIRKAWMVKTFEMHGGKVIFVRQNSRQKKRSRRVSQIDPVCSVRCLLPTEGALRRETFNATLYGEARLRHSSRRQEFHEMFFTRMLPHVSGASVHVMK